MNQKVYSLAEIKQAYDEAEDVGFYRYSIARFFFRPISFYGAWLFLRVGITPNQTTLISWVMVLLGCFMYIFVPPSSTWLPIALILGWAILDYMDGSMARVTNARSKYGHFIDVVGAYYMLAFLPICLGISLYRFPENSISSGMNSLGFEFVIEPAFVLILGAFAALNNILLRVILLRMQVTFGIEPREDAGESKGRIASLASWVEALISPRGFFFPLLILATAVGWLEWFVALYFLFYSSGLVAYVGLYTVKLHRQVVN